VEPRQQPAPSADWESTPLEPKSANPVKLANTPMIPVNPSSANSAAPKAAAPFIGTLPRGRVTALTVPRVRSSMKIQMDVNLVLMESTWIWISLNVFRVLPESQAALPSACPIIPRVPIAPREGSPVPGDCAKRVLQELTAALDRPKYQTLSANSVARESTPLALPARRVPATTRPVLRACTVLRERSRPI
jgi:hypothetical protein